MKTSFFVLVAASLALSGVSAQQSPKAATDQVACKFHITDTHDRPIEGVELRFEAHGDSKDSITFSYPGIGEAKKEPVAAITDASGDCSLSVSSSAKDYYSITKEGYVTRYVRVPFVTPIGSILLIKAATIKGKLLYSNGQPAANIGLMATSNSLGGQSANVDEGDNEMFFGGDISPTPTTNDKGEFEFDRLAPGVYNLTVSDFNLTALNGKNLTPSDDKTVPKGWVFKPHAVIALGEGEEVDKVDLEFERPVQLTGRVIEEESGKPVEGVTVTFEAQSPGAFMHMGNWPTAKTQSDGTFQCGVPEGEVTVEVTATPARASLDTDMAASTPPYQKEVKVVRGHTPSVTLRLPVALMHSPRAPHEEVLTGVVLNSANRPVSGAEVDLIGFTPLGPDKKLVSDSNGRFTYKGTLPVTLQLRAIKGSGVTNGLTVLPKSRHVVLKLLDHAFGRIHGKMLAADGTPVSGENMALSSQSIGSSSGVGSTTTDKAGNFAFDHLPPGDYCVTPGGGADFESTQSLGLGPSEDKAVTCRLKLPTQPESGQVLDTDGKPLKGAIVSTQMNSNQTVTDADGRFTIKPLDSMDTHLNVMSGQRYGQFEVNKDGIYRMPPSNQGPSADDLVWMKPERQVGSPAKELDVAKWVSAPVPNLASLKGHVVLLYFWALWNKDSVDGLFAIDKLTQKFPGKLDVVAINSTDDESNVAALYKAQKFGFRLAVDKTGQMIGKTAEEYHVTANSLVIIDRNGKIAYVGQDRNKATTLIHQLMVR